MKQGKQGWILVLSSALAVIGCGAKPVPVEEIRPVRTLTVGATPTKAENIYAGEVRARYESMLSFRVGGKIIARKVNVGSRVKAGQVLAQLDPKDLQLGASSARAQVAAADAQFQVATLDLARVRDLKAKGFASQAEFDRQETQFKAAKAQLDAIVAQSRQVSNQASYAMLVADTDGVVTAILAESGQVVAPGQPVVQLARAGEIEVAAAIPEDQIRYLHEGMPVQINLWSEAHSSIAGRIRELSAAADPATRTYAARVSVLQVPPEMQLRMTASVRITLTDLPDLIHIPAVSMVTRNGKAGVWVLQAQSQTVRFTPLQFSGVEGNEILVAEGLKAGDVVVTAGASYLNPEQKVKRLESPPTTAKAG